MSKKNYFLLFIIIIVGLCGLWLSGCTIDDVNSPKPEDFFIKFYGSSQAEAMVDVLPYNNGYLLLGSTNSTMSGDMDYLLIKTDALGNQIWKESIGFIYNVASRESINGQDEPSEMIIYDDVHIVIIGTTTFNITASNQGVRMFFAVVDVSGNMAVVKGQNIIFPPIPSDVNSIYLSNTSGNSLLRPKDLSGSFENALVIAGTTDSVSQKSSVPIGTDLKDVLIGKLLIDIATGKINSVSWLQRIGFSGSDFAVKALQSSNGNFNMVSITDRMSDFSGSGLNILFNVINIDGSKGPEYIYGEGSSNEVPVDMLVNGNNITILGNNTGVGVTKSSEAFLIGITANGGINFAPQKIIIPNQLATNNGNIATGLTRLQNANFSVSGQILAYSDPTGVNKQNEVFFYKTNQVGVLDSTSLQIYGGIGNDAGQTIMQNADGTLIIGATIDFQGGATVMSLMKTNANGQLKK